MDVKILNINQNNPFRLVQESDKGQYGQVHTLEFEAQRIAVKSIAF